MPYITEEIKIQRRESQTSPRTSVKVWLVSCESEQSSSKMIMDNLSLKLSKPDGMDHRLNTIFHT